MRRMLQAKATGGIHSRLHATRVYRF